MSISQVGRGDAAPSANSKIIDPVTGEVLRSAPGAPERAFLSPQAGRAGAVAAPPGNTGVTSFFEADTLFSVDYLSMTVHQDRQLVEAALKAVGLDFAYELVPGLVGRGYREVYKGLYGAQLSAVPINLGQTHVGLQFSGSVLLAMGVEKLLILRKLAATWMAAGIRVKCTRLDPAFDTRTFAAAHIETAMLAGLVKGQFRDWDPHRNYKGLELVGHTVAFGSRESEAYLRVYDKKDGCSFGDGVAFTRVELELKGRRADAAFWLLLDGDGGAAWVTGFAALLNGYIQVDTDWWRSFVLTLDHAWHIMGRKISSVAKKAAWLAYAAARSLAVVLAAKDRAQFGSGREWLEEIIAKGRGELTRLDECLIRSNESPGLLRVVVYGGAE